MYFSDNEIVNAYNDYFKNIKQDLNVTLGVDYKYKYKNCLKQQQKIFLYINKNIIKIKIRKIIKIFLIFFAFIY